MLIARKRNDVKIEGQVTHGSKMHINTEGQEHLVRLLTRAYSDKIGSTIRESVANAKDSHIMANQTLPVIVRIKKEENGEFSLEIEDRGLGLDDKEFHKYIMGIGESTKQLISNVLGGYGIGSKAASSYHEDSSYFYTCIKNGIERKFMIYSGEEVPESLLLHEKETEESNGVIVTIPIKNGDKYDFESKIKEQLCYFTGVYFENCNVDNDFKVYRNDLFQYSELYPFNLMHITLDDVVYPIDYNKLGINPIYFPVGVRFNLEEGLITPIPNRENIEYTKQTKQAILDRIKLVADYFVQKYNNDLTEMISVDAVYNYYQYSDKTVSFADENFKLKEILKYSEFKLAEPTFKGISKLKLITLHNNYSKFLQNYTTRAEISSGRFTTKNILSSGNITNCVKGGGKVILCNNELPNKKTIDFIKDTIGNCIFVKKAHQFTLGSISRTWGWRDNEFMGILELKKYHKSDWRQVISEYLSVVKQYEDKLIPIESIQITKEWEESRKKARKVAVQTTRKQKLEGEINFKLAERVDRSCDWSCKFISEVINLKDFHKRKGIIVYGLEEQRKKLDDLFNIYRTTYKNKVITAIVGQRDYEKLKNVKLHNLMTIEEFESGYNKPIARYVTAYKINKFYQNNKELFNNVNFIKDNLNKDLGECLKELNNYRDNYNNTDNSLMISLVTFCDKNKYYDYPIYQTLKEVEKECTKLNFLKFFVQKSNYYTPQINKEAIPIIQELLKARKFRMDWEHYLTKEVPVQEEELVEQD